MWHLPLLMSFYGSIRDEMIQDSKCIWRKGHFHGLVKFELYGNIHTLWFSYFTKKFILYQNIRTWRKFSNTRCTGPYFPLFPKIFLTDALENKLVILTIITVFSFTGKLKQNLPAFRKKPTGNIPASILASPIPTSSFHLNRYGQMHFFGFAAEIENSCMKDRDFTVCHTGGLVSSCYSDIKEPPRFEDLTNRILPEEAVHALFSGRYLVNGHIIVGLNSHIKGRQHNPQNWNQQRSSKGCAPDEKQIILTHSGSNQFVFD